MDDPDILELEESNQIDIFEPGTYFEREVDRDLLIRILLMVGAAFGIMIAISFVMMFPLLALGLMQMDLVTGSVSFTPWAAIILATAEIGLIIPPLWYVRKNGFPLRSIGIKNFEPFKEIVLGLIIGAIMLGANLIVSWFVTIGTEGIAPSEPSTDVEGMFSVNTPAEAIAWILVMFLIVGTTEEILFRGFLQRRMEMYFKKNNSKNYRFWTLVITSFIFAAVHLDLIGIPTRFMLGMVLGYFAQKRKYSVLGPSVAHGFNNAAIIVLIFFGF
ncbi:MAG: lysostaphin resistance A-like protein [Candidatus Thorarchaeota archaeon]